MRSYLIVGTDYGVGKTYVTLALLRALRAAGVAAVGYHPVACGDRGDARAMREVTDPQLSLDEVNPLYLRAGAAPLIAAELERRTVEPEVLVQDAARLQERYPVVLAELLGGWEVPLTSQETMADLAQHLKWPILLVADNTLGVESRITLMSRDMARRGLECVGVVLNNVEESWDTAAVTNKQLIERCTGLPVVAEFIRDQEDVDLSMLT